MSDIAQTCNHQDASLPMAAWRTAGWNARHTHQVQPP